MRILTDSNNRDGVPMSNVVLYLHPILSLLQYATQYNTSVQKVSAHIGIYKHHVLIPKESFVETHYRRIPLKPIVSSSLPLTPVS